MVPASWEHPKDERGNYIALLGGSFKERADQWDEEARQWDNGFVRGFATDGWKPKGPEHTGTFADWDGERPEEKDYMPDWPEAERTHYQLYESTSNGMPISPVMETPEALAYWLVDSNVSAFAGMGATYEQWLAIIKRGLAVCAVSSPRTGCVSGVEWLCEK
ncbi:hypothetical protein FJZ23_02065 [Candidatus Parcubacteria bacterium]|nr:hypothetical protein [Candidatus Parcubacteria bacterium]